MPELRLSKLPDRTPVKITITVNPELNRNLHAYGELYRETYGAAEAVPELIPYMLETFLESDRSFAKARKEKPLGEPPNAAAHMRRGRPRRSGPPASSSIAS
jgi:hypothetical protein